MAHDRHVVEDNNIAHAVCAPERLEEIEHLRLDRYVEGLTASSHTTISGFSMSARAMAMRSR